MKKYLSLILALAMALCLVACGEATPAVTNPSDPVVTDPVDPAVENYGFTYNGTKITMHADAAPILEALGEPVSQTEETSCAFDGLDKTYYYGSFYLQTYPQGDKDYVFAAWFMDDSVTTDEGVYVGMPQAQVEAIYGADSFDGENAYVLTGTDSVMTVIVIDGAVTSIQYDIALD